MPNTYIYDWWYADAGTETALFPEKDRERWESLEIQIFELMSMFGNGALSGWEISDTVADGPIVYITPGTGHVSYKAAETTDDYGISLLIPTGVDMTKNGITYYVYGYATETTHFDKSIIFEAFTVPQTNDEYIYIGSFLLKIADGHYVISSKDYTNRDNISIFSSISDLINSHVHTGNPPKINLPKHTSGKLPGAFIADDLSASQITEGKMSLDRLPQISHNDLSDKGVLTHPEMDTYFTNQSMGVEDHLADIAFSNWLQGIIAQKTIYIRLWRRVGKNIGQTF